MKKIYTRSVHIGVFFLFFLIPFFSKGQSLPAYSLSGFAELDFIAYPKNFDNSVNGRNQGILQLEIQNRERGAFGYFGAVEFRNDISDPERNRLWLDELYFTWKRAKLDVQIGKIVYSWGSTDGFNPTNNLNPIDYSDLLDTKNETIGVYSLNTKVYLGNHYLEGVVIPVFQPSVLPGSNSRWNSIYPTHLAMDEKVVPAVYSFYQANQKPADWRSIQFAGRLGGTVGALDYNLSYYNGFDDLPYLHRNNRFLHDTLYVGITPEYHAIQVFGGDIAAVVGGTIVKAELAYIDQEKPEDQDWFMGAPYWYGVLGVEKRVQGLWSNLDFLLNVQWIYQDIQSAYEVNSFNFNHIFKNAAFLHVELGKYASWNMAFTGVYDFSYNHYWIKPALEYKPDPNLTIKLSSDILGGKKTTLFGSYDNNRLQLLTKYSF